MTYILMVSDEAKLRLNETVKKNPELARRYLKKFEDILKDPFHFEILKAICTMLGKPKYISKSTELFLIFIQKKMQL